MVDYLETLNSGSRYLPSAFIFVVAECGHNKHRKVLGDSEPVFDRSIDAWIKVDALKPSCDIRSSNT